MGEGAPNGFPHNESNDPTWEDIQHHVDANPDAWKGRAPHLEIHGVDTSVLQAHEASQRETVQKDEWDFSRSQTDEQFAAAEAQRMAGVSGQPSVVEHLPAGTEDWIFDVGERPPASPAGQFDAFITEQNARQAALISVSEVALPSGAAEPAPAPEGSKPYPMTEGFAQSTDMPEGSVRWDLNSPQPGVESERDKALWQDFSHGRTSEQVDEQLAVSRPEQPAGNDAEWDFSQNPSVADINGAHHAAGLENRQKETDRQVAAGEIADPWTFDRQLAEQEQQRRTG